MKPCSIIFFSLLTTTLILSSLQLTHASSCSSTLLVGRPAMRKLLNKVAGEDDVNYNGEDLIYHVDYQGVSTHPYPSPKHHPKHTP
ncbi:hypothetical protein ACHQM5_030539 [Ranunculus cassubicifolius]